LSQYDKVAGFAYPGRFLYKPATPRFSPCFSNPLPGGMNIAPLASKLVCIALAADQAPGNGAGMGLLAHANSFQDMQQNNIEGG
jgi:hypothetical protein